jgi:hypothetical protein
MIQIAPFPSVIPRPLPRPEAHASEDLLEAYVMGSLQRGHYENLSVHLSTCDLCCLRLVREWEFIEALRGSLRDFKP